MEMKVYRQECQKNKALLAQSPKLYVVTKSGARCCALFPSFTYNDSHAKPAEYIGFNLGIVLYAIINRLQS
jgi:hypothetical protein